MRLAPRVAAKGPRTIRSKHCFCARRRDLRRCGDAPPVRVTLCRSHWWRRLEVEKGLRRSEIIFTKAGPQALRQGRRVGQTEQRGG